MVRLNRDKQKGFTIVELVVVIIILGILAATALPRFLDVSEDAHISAADSVEGALNAGLASVKAAWLVNSKISPVTLEGESYIVNANGFVTDTEGTADLNTCSEILTSLVRIPSIAKAAATDLTSAAAIGGTDGVEWYAQGDVDTASLATCKFYYLGRGFSEGQNYTLLSLTLATGVVVKTGPSAIGS